jgi:hypothetical protein
MKRKWLAIGIILLFVGVTIAPTINFNTVKASTDDDLVHNKEYIKTTVELCGLNTRTTINLTQDEVQEIKNVFLTYKNKFDQTTTREQAEQILIELLDELHTYHLIENQSLPKIHRLIQSSLTRNPIKNHPEWINQQETIKQNLGCFVLGQTSDTVYCSTIVLRLLYGSAFGFLLFGSVFPRIALLLYFMAMVPIAFLLASYMYYIVMANTHKPSILNTMTLGYELNHEIIPSKGWISSIGLLGKTNQSGALMGALYILPIPFIDALYYPALVGFTGVKVIINEYATNVYYFGYCLGLKISSEPINQTI